MGLVMIIDLFLGVCASSLDFNIGSGLSPTGYNQQILCNESEQTFNNTSTSPMFNNKQSHQHPLRQHYHHHHSKQKMQYAVPNQALTAFKADSQINESITSTCHAAVISSSYSDSSTAPYHQMPNHYSDNAASLDIKSKQHQENQIDQQQLVDDQLMSKVSKMSLAQVTYLLEQKQRELSVTSRIIRDQIASSREIVLGTTNCCKIRLQDAEEFC